MTEGRFFVDEKLNRADLVRDTDRPAVCEAATLARTMTVYKLAGDTCEPMRDVQVGVWHCDAVGVHFDELNPMNREDTASQKWLRGYQQTGDDCLVTFNTMVRV